MFRIFLVYRLHLGCFPAFCIMPGADPRAPHIVCIGHEETWGDWFCQGWLWAKSSEEPSGT